MSQTNKKHSCADCGNNPTSHTLSYIQNTGVILLQPFFGILIDTPIIRQSFLFIAQMLFRVYLPLFKLFGVLSWNIDSSRVSSLRSKVIWDEAIARNISVRQLVSFGKPLELYEATIRGKKYLYESIPRPPKFQSISDSWMDDKYILKQKLQTAGIPTPNGSSVYTKKQAQRLFAKLSKPVITKPRLGSRGRHTTTYIQDENELVRGFKSAQRLGAHVIVEEHIRGSVYRATCIGGVLTGLLEGRPPRITGDGIHPVTQLIDIKNKNRDTRIAEVLLDSHTLHFIKKQGYTPETILEKGTTIDLSEKIGTSYGGTSCELFDKVHPKLVAYLEKAAKVVYSPVIGFDFITTDPTVDPDTLDWGIIECNSLPFINLHHFPIEGTPQNVAGKVWDLWTK